jgi:prevent-host-death family protein
MFGRLVAEVQAPGKVVTITKDGVPAAVLLSADEFESMQETIFWLSQPGIRLRGPGGTRSTWGATSLKRRIPATANGWSVPSSVAGRSIPQAE